MNTSLCDYAKLNSLASPLVLIRNYLYILFASNRNKNGKAEKISKYEGIGINAENNLSEISFTV